MLNGQDIPVLGLGTWKIGGETLADHSKDKEAISSIKNALEIGYSHIDTAEMYGAGHCEELVGKAIRLYAREKLFLTTKVLSSNLAYDDVIVSCKKSLARLGTNYVDLYLIHAPNPNIALKETMRAMDYLVEQKMIGAVGVSNFTLELLQEAQSLSKNPICANQIEYSLLTRNVGIFASNIDMESKTIPYCQKNGIIVMAERPLERGLLLSPHPVLDKICKKYGKSCAQIALNWLISKKNMVTMPMSTKTEHLKENLGALDFGMSTNDLELLDNATFSV